MLVKFEEFLGEAQTRDIWVNPVNVAYVRPSLNLKRTMIHMIKEPLTGPAEVVESVDTVVSAIDAAIWNLNH